MVAMFTDDSQAMLRVLALHENGQAQPGLDYPVAGSPCAQVVGRAYRYLACGVRAQVAGARSETGPAVRGALGDGAGRAEHRQRSLPWAMKESTAR